ncbi:MAG: PfkB family carbohydrate kinase [Stackebrandtia sp.]
MPIAASCLTVASADPTGGAGVQADLRVFAAAGCFGMAVVPLATAQTGQWSGGTAHLPEELVLQQLSCVRTAHRLDAVKLGSLSIPVAVAVEIRRMCAEENLPLVVDPVLVSASGSELCSIAQAVTTLEVLRGSITLLTPNPYEATRLAGHVNREVRDRRDSARTVGDWLDAAVVVTSGGDSEGIDVLYSCGTHRELLPTEPPLEADFVHGAGCTYSAAVTAMTARGAELSAAVAAAKRATEASVHAGFQFRNGVRVPFVSEACFLDVEAPVV